MPTHAARACAMRQMLLVMLLCAMPVTLAAQPSDATVATLREAWRISNTGSGRVELPDTLAFERGMALPLRASYAFSFESAAPPARLALWLPGLIAHARVRLNGHVLLDRLDDPTAPLPRGSERIRFIEVPQEFVRQGKNHILIEVAGPDTLRLSPLFVGPPDVLERRHERRLFGVVIGPGIVAVVVASLALCVLLLWVRRGEAMYGYFAVGSLAWALHTAWSVSPISLMPPLHRHVWWTTLYGFFVVMLVIFCMRFAGWRWPRFERTATLASLAGPLWLYPASYLGIENAQELWLLGAIGMVVIGLAAVWRYVWMHRNTASTLLLLTGAVSLGFAAHDWFLNHAGSDNNPVYLVPYAGLLFVMLVAWLLIDRFVSASSELELMNFQLEQRVSAKSEELTRALSQMSDARDHAEAANRTKTHFLAAASHDLRQPIHALGLYVQALGEARLDAEQTELVQRIKASLGVMRSMFDALLDISRMDAGAVVPQRQSFRIDLMLRRLAAELAPLADEKDLRLSLYLGKFDRAPFALSDPLLVERILQNLLGNALKYTTSGGVLLSCRRRGCDRWRVEIWDTGAGIPAADQARVFEEFFQVSNPERDREAGLGLGLAIVRRLCDLLGHALVMHSQLGRGTHFALELPCSEEAPPTEHEVLQRPLHSGLVVGVIEDDPEGRDSMQRLLQRWGCRVYTGADETELLRQDDLGQVLQAVIADYRLRGRHNGIDAIHALRAACGREIPALIVSGDTSPRQLAAIQASGLPFLSKPVQPALIHDWLSTAVHAFEEAR